MDLSAVVRQAIYTTIASTGRAPTVDDVATRLLRDPSDVATAYRDLADAHVIVLEPGTVHIWSAPPFSAVPTSFHVYAASPVPGVRRPAMWHAPCAWDAFGIPAALNEDVAIDARCAWSGRALPASVSGVSGVHDGQSDLAGSAIGEGVIHLEVPAKHFWDDIFYT